MPRIIYPAHFEPVAVPAAPIPAFGWFVALTAPQGRRGFGTVLAASGATLPPSQAKETTTVDRWHQPLSLFPGARPGLHASQQPPFAWHVSTARETSTVDRWWQPLSLPTPPRAGLHVSQQPAFTWHVSIARETTTVDRWWQPLSLPTRRTGLQSSQQPALVWQFVAPPPTPPNFGWYASLAMPVWRLAGLGSARQQAFFWHISTDPGGGPPPPPPAPTGGGGGPLGANAHGIRLGRSGGRGKGRRPRYDEEQLLPIAAPVDLTTDDPATAYAMAAVQEVIAKQEALDRALLIAREADDEDAIMALLMGE